MTDTMNTPRGGRLAIPRSRGAASGLLVLALGAWGALAPFVGPYLDLAYDSRQAWMWTATRGWLEVLPGAVAVVGGALLVASRNRVTAMLGGWLSVAAGGWFIAGRSFIPMLAIGDIGTPAAVTDARRLVIELAFFTGLGLAIAVLGALAVGRLSVRSARDLRYVQPDPVPVAAAAAEPEGLPTRRRNMFWRRRTPVPH